MSHIFRILKPWRGSFLNYTPVGDYMLRVGTCMVAHLSNKRTTFLHEANHITPLLCGEGYKENFGFIKRVW